MKGPCYTSLLVSEDNVIPVLPVSRSVWLDECSLELFTSTSSAVAIVTLFLLVSLSAPPPLLLWGCTTCSCCCCCCCLWWILEGVWWWGLDCSPLPLSLFLLLPTWPPLPPTLPLPVLLVIVWLLLLLLFEEKSSLKRPRRERSSFHVIPQPIETKIEIVVSILLSR